MNNLPKGISLRPIIIKTNKKKIENLNNFETTYEYVQNVTLNNTDFLQNLIEKLKLNSDNIFEKSNDQINGIKLKTGIKKIEKFHDFYTGKFYFEELWEDLSFKEKKFSIPQTTLIEFFIRQVENGFLLYLCSSIEKLNSQSVKIDQQSNRTIKHRIVDFFASIIGQSECQIYTFKLSATTLNEIRRNLTITGDVIERGDTFGGNVRIGGSNYFIYFSRDGGIYTPSDIDKNKILNFHKEEINNFIIPDRYQLYPQLKRKRKDIEDDENTGNDEEQRNDDDEFIPFHF